MANTYLMTNKMTEKQIEKALFTLGCENVTTERQKKNGTTSFKLPTGQMVTEHSTGYIRKQLLSSLKNKKYDSCYQLNPTYPIDYKVVTSDGKHRIWKQYKRMLIYSRAERLKRLLLFTINKLNETV
jgi:hypothetical protein